MLQLALPNPGPSAQGPNLKDLNEIISRAPKNSNLFKASKSNGVRLTEDFHRVDNLPRRMWANETAEKLAGELTEVLKKPAGKMRLKPVQAIALLEIGMYGGALCSMRAGAGKTLVTLIAPYILDAQRPVLLVPAKLREKTRRDMVEYGEHFYIGYWLHVLSYEELGRVGKATFLEDIKADLIIPDEAHKLKNTKAAVTRRVKRYVENHPVKVVALSGTVTKRSLQDFAHLAYWSLKDGAPVPRQWSIIEEWACALDERPRSTFRTPPGVLTKWSGGSIDLNEVRRGFQRRINDTPGVISTYDRPGCSLTITRIETPECPAIREAFKTLRDKSETPDGWPTLGGLDDARHAREIALGYFSRWEPRAPETWMRARREWGAMVRYVIQHNRQGIDSELQVAHACHKREINTGLIAERLGIDENAWQNWVAVRDTFKPNPVPVWISEVPLRAAAAWLQEGSGICWTEHVPFATRLAEITGVPYCGAGGVDANGRFIESFAGAPVIASVQSSGEGRNLQAWNRNLITSPMSLGLRWEQLIARTDRDGQEADEVTVDVLVGCFENEMAFEQAQRDADYIEATTGQQQRLQYADKVWPKGQGTGPVWQK